MNNRQRKKLPKRCTLVKSAPKVTENIGAVFAEHQSLADWFEQSVNLIKQDEFSEVGFADTEILGRVYVKRYRAKSLLHRVAMMLNVSRAVHSFDNTLALFDLGIPVPSPYAVFVERNFLGIPQQSYYLCQGLLGARDMKSLWQQDGAENTPAILDWLKLIGKQLAELHNAGYVHGDCKWSNILLLHSQVFFVDLDNIGKIPDDSRAASRDLARFILNAEELSIGKSALDSFLETYRDNCKNFSSALFEAIGDDLAKLRQRHRARYGHRGAELF